MRLQQSWRVTGVLGFVAAALVVGGQAKANIFIEGVDVGPVFIDPSGQTYEGTVTTPAVEVTGSGDLLLWTSSDTLVVDGTGVGMRILDGLVLMPGGAHRAGTLTGTAVSVEGGRLDVAGGDFYAGGVPGVADGTGTGISITNATARLGGGNFAAGGATGTAVSVGAGADVTISGGNLRAGGLPGGDTGTGTALGITGGMVTISGGSFRAGGSTGDAVRASGGVATIDGGDLNVTTGTALAVWSGGNVTVNGGDFSSPNAAISVGLGGGGDLTIHDIKLVNTAAMSRGIQLWGGKTVINGGTFHNLTDRGSMITTTGDPTLEIYDGDFQNTEGDLLELTFADGYSIHGGSFLAADGNAVSVGLNATVKVWGGSFDSLTEEAFEVRSNALLQVFGDAFWVNGVPVDLGPDNSYFVPEMAGDLTVQYVDGTTESFDFKRVFSSSSVQLIPEPASILLLGLMGAFALRRR